MGFTQGMTAKQADKHAILMGWVETKVDWDDFLPARQSPVEPRKPFSPADVHGATYKWIARILGAHKRFRWEREFVKWESGDYILREMGTYEFCELEGRRTLKNLTD
jgi:hypothetical protein